MKKLSITIGLAVLLVAGSGYALYETVGSPQHRRPSAPAAQPPSQPKESRPAPPAQPRAGRTAPPDAPRTGQAVPRAPAGRRDPQDHPRGERPRGPERVYVPYPGWPWWGYPYPYGYPLAPWGVVADWETSAIRLDVSPKDAQVYVDRYLAGVVDDFDGIFQHLTLRPGPHLIEIRKPGFITLTIEVNLQPGQSITYCRTMEPSHGELDGPSPLPVAPEVDGGAALNAPPGDVKFDVTPREAAVYVDGFYAGIADDFDGVQHLQLSPGRRHLVLKLDGYESIEVDLAIDSAQSTTYRATLKTTN